MAAAENNSAKDVQRVQCVWDVLSILLFSCWIDLRAHTKHRVLFQHCVNSLCWDFPDGRMEAWSGWACRKKACVTLLMSLNNKRGKKSPLPLSIACSSCQPTDCELVDGLWLFLCGWWKMFTGIGFKSLQRDLQLHWKFSTGWKLENTLKIRVRLMWKMLGWTGVTDFIVPDCRIWVLAQLDVVWCGILLTWKTVTYILYLCKHLYVCNLYSKNLHNKYLEVFMHTQIYTCTHIPQTALLLLSCPHTLSMKHRENSEKWFKGFKRLQGIVCQDMVQ